MKMRTRSISRSLRGTLAILSFVGAIGYEPAAQAALRSHTAAVVPTNHIPFGFGDVFVGAGNGLVRHFDGSGTLLETLDTTTGCAEDLGMAFTAAGHLLSTASFGSCFGSPFVIEFDNQGGLIGPFGSGYSSSTESITIDGAGNVYVGQPDGTADVLKFDSAGTPLGAFDVPVGPRGSDWIDLAADQCTLFYTSEGGSIRRYDVCNDAALPDFCVGCGVSLTGMRIDPAGGAFAADFTGGVVRRFDATGMEIDTYSAPGLVFPFAFNLDPDGTSFWTGDYQGGQIFKFDIATGAVLLQFDGMIAGSAISGLAVFGERLAGRETSCDDGIDNDGDGFIDCADSDCGMDPVCQSSCFTLDFETEDDFATPLVNGQHINTEFQRLVEITAAGPNEGAAIFDSSNPGPNDQGLDPDLLTNTGNILILQTANFPVDGNDVFPVPDDERFGGTLGFLFASPVAPRSVDLIDVDANDPFTVTLADASGLTRVYFVPEQWTGDLSLGAPGIGTLDLTTLASQAGFAAFATASEDEGFDPSAVVSIEVFLDGSGGLDNLTWCADGATAEVPPRNGSGWNRVALSSNQLPALGRSWLASLDCRGFGSGVASLFLCQNAIAGEMTPFGERLIGGPVVYRTARSFSGAVSQMSWDVPNDLALMGLEVHAQGLCHRTALTLGPKLARQSGGLSNALDLTLGF